MNQLPLPQELIQLIYSFMYDYKQLYDYNLKFITKSYVREFKYRDKFRFCLDCDDYILKYKRHENIYLSCRYHKTISLREYNNKNHIIRYNKYDLFAKQEYLENNHIKPKYYNDYLDTLIKKKYTYINIRPLYQIIDNNLYKNEIADYIKIELFKYKYINKLSKKLDVTIPRLINGIIKEFEINLKKKINHNEAVDIIYDMRNE